MNETGAPREGETLDVANKWAVGGNSSGLRIMAPPRGVLTKQEAYTLAAWLVTMADIMPGEVKFADVLDAVQNT